MTLLDEVLTLFEAKKFIDARRLLTELLQDNEMKNEAQLWVLLASACSVLRDFDAALAAYHTAAEKIPGSPEIRLGLANELLSSRAPAEKIQEVLKREPKLEPSTHLKRSWLSLRKALRQQYPEHSWELDLKQ